MKVEKDKMNVLGEKYATVVLIEALRSEEDLKLSDLLSLITNYRTVELLCNKLVQNDL